MGHIAIYSTNLHDHLLSGIVAAEKCHKLPGVKPSNSSLYNNISALPVDKLLIVAFKLKCRLNGNIDILRAVLRIAVIIDRSISEWEILELLRVSYCGLLNESTSLTGKSMAL